MSDDDIKDDDPVGHFLRDATEDYLKKRNASNKAFLESHCLYPDASVESMTPKQTHISEITRDMYNDIVEKLGPYYKIYANEEVQPKEEQRKSDGLCPKCGEHGPYIKLQPVCSKHGPY